MSGSSPKRDLPYLNAPIDPPKRSLRYGKERCRGIQVDEQSFAQARRLAAPRVLAPRPGWSPPPLHPPSMATWGASERNTPFASEYGAPALRRSRRGCANPGVAPPRPAKSNGIGLTYGKGGALGIQLTARTLLTVGPSRHASSHPRVQAPQHLHLPNLPRASVGSLLNVSDLIRPG